MDKLTAAEIGAMPAGFELDRLVAERVFDWSDLWQAPTGRYFGESPDERRAGLDAERIPVPMYSSEIAAAWQVVDHMGATHGFRGHNGFTIVGGPGVRDWYCEFPSPRWESGTADTAPLAICRAALHATMP